MFGLEDNWLEGGGVLHTKTLLFSLPGCAWQVCVGGWWWLKANLVLGFSLGYGKQLTRGILFDIWFLLVGAQTGLMWNINSEAWKYEDVKMRAKIWFWFQFQLKFILYVLTFWSETKKVYMCTDSCADYCGHNISMQIQLFPFATLCLMLITFFNRVDSFLRLLVPYHYCHNPNQPNINLGWPIYWFSLSSACTRTTTQSNL